MFESAPPPLWRGCFPSALRVGVVQVRDKKNEKTKLSAFPTSGYSGNIQFEQVYALHCSIINETSEYLGHQLLQCIATVLTCSQQCWNPCLLQKVIVTKGAGRLLSGVSVQQDGLCLNHLAFLPTARPRGDKAKPGKNALKKKTHTHTARSVILNTRTRQRRPLFALLQKAGGQSRSAPKCRWKEAKHAGPDI